MDHERDELSKLEFLKSFDSNIEIHDALKTFSKKHIQLSIDRRLKDIESECLESDLEKTRTYNLLSFFYFAINKQYQAFSYNKQAREIDGRNINTLVCCAYFHLKCKDYFECEQVCEILSNLQPTKLELLVARAEVAYTYTKLDIRYYQTAVDKFKELLNDTIDIPDKYVCSWKFSMALALRRQLHISNNPSMTHYLEAETHYREVERLYKEIISLQGDNIRGLQAKACVELGLEIYIKRERILHETDFESCESHKYIDQALLLEPDDDFVLSRSGKYFRLIKQPAKSVELLTKALHKKATSFAHHHLALALRDQIYLKAGDTTDRTGRSRQNELDVVYNRDDQRAPERVQNFERQNYSTLRANSGITPNMMPVEPTISKSKHRQNSFPTRLHGDTIIRAIKTQNDTHSPEALQMRKLIRCPGKLRYFPRDNTKEILKHLDMAFKLNNTNINALYDKGLLLRSSEQTTAAVDVFKTIFRQKSCSDLQLANAYEQAALCLLDEAEQMPSKQQRNEHNAKKYLSKSCGISCDIVARIPNLIGCWRSFPTLRSLLLSKPRTKQNLKELTFLYKKVDKWKTVIAILQKILNLEEEESKRREVMMEIVESNVQIEQYDDAIVLLNLILCLPNGQEKIDKVLYVRAHIKGGIAAWRTDEKRIAQNYLRDAVHTGEIWKSSEEKARANSEISYDIFILSSEDSEDMARSVCDLLTQFGLKVTLNSDAVMPGQHELEEMQAVKDKSEYIAVFLNEETEAKDIQHMQVMFTDNISKHIITISESERASRDPIYSRFPPVPFERDMFSRVTDVTDVTEEQVSWMETFLFTLTGVSPTSKP